MRIQEAPLRFSIVNSVKDIPKEDWEDVFGQGLIEGWGYQKTLEEASLKEFTFGYLLGKRGNKLALIIPFFSMEFSFDMLIRGPLHKLACLLKRFLSMRLLFLGSPTTEEFYLGIKESEDLNSTFDRAIKELREFCRTKRINGLLFYSLSKSNSRLIEYLKARRFIKMETLPTTLVEVRSASLEDYINGLSRNTRKDLKRKLKRSLQQGELKTELLTDVSGILDEIYKLYMNNFSESDVRFEVLTPEFFGKVCSNMPGVAKYFITYAQNKMVAFNLCLIKDGVFIDKFIGFDKDAAHKYHLYFTTFCHNIDWCIENNLRYYQPGTTDYYPKIRLGAKLVPLYIYSIAFNPLLNAFLHCIAKFIEPKNIDPVLKNLTPD